MMTSQIQCFKYNNSLDQEVQKETCFDAFISLSSDGKELVITNRRYQASDSESSSSESKDSDESDFSESEEEENDNKKEQQDQAGVLEQG